MFRDLLHQRGLAGTIQVDSAGTGGWHVGEAPHPGTLHVLKARSIPSQGLRARQLSARELDDWDHVLVMDQTNLHHVRTREPKHARVHLLLDFHPHPPAHREVPDPYQTGRFEEVYQLIGPALEGFLNHLTGAGE